MATPEDPRDSPGIGTARHGERQPKDDGPYTEAGYFRDGLADPQHRERLAGLPPGLLLVRGAVPPGILVIQGALPDAQRQSILDYVRTAPAVRSTVHDVSAGFEGRRTVASSIRTSEFIDVAGIRDTVLGCLAPLLLRDVAPFFGRQIQWLEYPEILRYRPGGEYKPHADADHWDNARQRWHFGADRDFSLLVYLNGEFTGGELEFPNFGFRLRPQPGTLVAFPSDHRYVHAARPVQSGERYVLVSWLAMVDSRPADAEPPRGAVPGAQLRAAREGFSRL